MQKIAAKKKGSYRGAPNIDNLFSLKGKVAIVSGASGGLGSEISIALARTGSTVVLVGRNSQRLKDLVDAIELFGGKAFATETDVSN